MGRALLFGLVLFTSQAATALTAVLAINSIVMALGRAPLLAVWTLKAALNIAWATGSASMMTRFGARRMLSVGLRATAVAYGVIALVAGSASYGPLALGLLVLLDDAQMNGIYHAAWGLAREQMSSAETLRYFGRVAAMYTMGAVTGTAIAGLVLRFAVPTGHVLAALAVIFLLVSLVVPRAFDGESVPPSMRAFVSGEQPRADLREAIRFVRSTPALRTVALLAIANGLGYTLLDYEVIRVLASVPDFGVRYAALTTVEPLCQVVTEAGVAPWAVGRFGTRAAFITPLVLALDFLLLLFYPSVISAIVAAIALHSAFGIEALARSYTVAQAPPAVRQSIGVLSDGTYYPLGYILACALLFGMILGGAGLAVAEARLRTPPLILGAIVASLTLFGARHLHSASSQRH